VEGMDQIHFTNFDEHHIKPNFDGHEIKVNTKFDRIEMRSGFGYDRIKRQMKFPVYISQNPKKISKKHDTYSQKFDSVGDFLYEVHSPKSSFAGGLVTFTFF
jgi:viroplasmin and RNaseH domain-containing protein